MSSSNTDLAVDMEVARQAQTCFRTSDAFRLAPRTLHAKGKGMKLIPRECRHPFRGSARIAGLVVTCNFYLCLVVISFC